MKGKVSIFYWAKIDYSGWKEQVQKFNESGGNLFYGRDILMSEMTHKAGRAAFWNRSLLSLPERTWAAGTLPAAQIHSSELMAS